MPDRSRYALSLPKSFHNGKDELSSAWRYGKKKGLDLVLNEGKFSKDCFWQRFARRAGCLRVAMYGNGKTKKQTKREHNSTISKW